MSNENPYQPSSLYPGILPVESGLARTIPWRIWWIAYLYPIWSAGSMYATWVLAWVHLGHIPRSSLDDPMSIGSLVTVAYTGSLLLMSLMPILMPMGLLAAFFYPLRTRARRSFLRQILLALLYITLSASVLLTLRADPGFVMEWWFD